MPQVIDLLTQGKGEVVIAALEMLSPLSPPPDRTRSVAETEAEYLRTNQQRMRSPLFRAQSLHIWAVGLPQPLVKQW